MPEPLCIYHVDLNFVNIRPAYLRKWLRAIADMGYNAVLWELEDKVKWETCPDAIWPEAMSKAEFRVILDEASDLGLEAIPLLQTVGHAEYMLKHSTYSHMRELPYRHDCYCTEKPETREFLKGLIAEYLDLFGDIRRFHLGGDEAYAFAQCPDCSSKAEYIGHNALYARHIMDISAPIRDRDVRPGIWGDMVLGHPEQMDSIPTVLDIWDWNYWDQDGPLEQVRVWGKGMFKREDLTDGILEQFPEILTREGTLNGFYTSDALQRMGHDVILCSAARSAGDSFFCPRTHLHARNIAGAARKAASSDLLGTCVTDWAIRLNSWETHRTFLPLAPVLLREPPADVDETLESVCLTLFGCDATLFLEAVDRISSVTFPFSQAHSTAVQWNGMKDSLPAPQGYICRLLEEWERGGRLEKELQAIDGIIDQIAKGMAKLAPFIPMATSGFDTLYFWMRAAHFQLWQARMAGEILRKRRSPENAMFLRMLKKQYKSLLSFDQTPASAAKNAGLVYDALIEYMESG